MQTIWKPANAVGETFVVYVHALADLFGQDSGVNVAIPRDTFFLDIPQMEHFVAVLLADYLRTRHKLTVGSNWIEQYVEGGVYR